MNEAEIHAQAALPAVTGEYYEGGHWLGLYHPSEYTGDLFDTLADTPLCQCTAACCWT